MACENDMKEINDIGKKKTAIEQADSVISYLSQEAKLKAKLTAPKMLRYLTDSPMVEFPNTLHVDFYKDSITVESVLNAKYGNYKEGQHKVFLKDSVVVYNSVGDTLHCKELYWDQLKQIFYTDKEVAIRKRDGITFGVGMIVDQNFKWYTIDKPTGYMNIGQGQFAVY
jgi:LPS export ABC transporter protein LptC